jgi:hypothetical protein
MAREFLRFTLEQGPPKSFFGAGSNYGVFYGSGAQTIIQLTDSNQFTVRPVVVPWEIRGASGYNRRLIRGSGTAGTPGGTPRAMVQGTLGNCIIYDSQATFWFGIQSPGSYGDYGMIDPVPVGTSFELNSYTIDHAVLSDDASNTLIYRRYLGCRVRNATISADSDSQLLRISCDFVGHAAASPNITVTDFPEPTFAGGAGPQFYPVGNPFVLAHAGTYTFGTTGARTEFEAFNVTVENLIDSTFFNSTNLTRTKFCGRNVNATVVVPLAGQLNADRVDYEAATTPHPATVTFTNGTHVITFAFGNVQYTSGVTDNLDYNRVFRQNIAMVNFVDTTVPGDMNVYAS